MIGKIIAFAVLIIAATTTISQADSWSFPPVVDEKIFEFGRVRIIRTIDSTRNNKYPDYSISIYKEGELRALYRGVSFDHIAASKTNNLFIGVSNRGLPGTALVMFDADGNLKAEIKHGFSNFNYCRKTSTLARVWYHESTPDIKFEQRKFRLRDVEHTSSRIKSISIRDCKGNRRDLFEILNQAMGLEN